MFAIERILFNSIRVRQMYDFLGKMLSSGFEKILNFIELF